MNLHNGKQYALYVFNGLKIGRPIIFVKNLRNSNNSSNSNNNNSNSNNSDSNNSNSNSNKSTSNNSNSNNNNSSFCFMYYPQCSVACMDMSTDTYSSFKYVFPLFPPILVLKVLSMLSQIFLSIQHNINTSHIKYQA